MCVFYTTPLTDSTGFIWERVGTILDTFLLSFVLPIAMTHSMGWLVWDTWQVGFSVFGVCRCEHSCPGVGCGSSRRQREGYKTDRTRERWLKWDAPLCISVLAYGKLQSPEWEDEWVIQRTAGAATAPTNSGTIFESHMSHYACYAKPFLPVGNRFERHNHFSPLRHQHQKKGFVSQHKRLCFVFVCVGIRAWGVNLTNVNRTGSNYDRFRIRSLFDHCFSCGGIFAELRRSWR